MFANLHSVTILLITDLICGDRLQSAWRLGLSEIVKC